jgi:hypothetical protein
LNDTCATGSTVCSSTPLTYYGVIPIAREPRPKARYT